MDNDDVDDEIEMLLSNYEPDPEPTFLPIHMYKYVVTYITQDLDLKSRPLWTRKLKLSDSLLFTRFHKIETIRQIKYKTTVSVFRLETGVRIVIRRPQQSHEFASAVFFSPTVFHAWYAQFRTERPTSSLLPGASN